MNLAQFGKAAYAAVVSFVGALAVVMVGDIGFAEITDGQWVGAALAALVSFGGVYGIPYVPRGE